MAAIIPLQQEFRQSIPLVIGNVDYLIFKETLERISELIKLSHLDLIVMQHFINEAEKEAMKEAKENGKVFKGLTYKHQERIQKTAMQALRLGIARKLLEEAYRPFSCRLADSFLLQRFCLLDNFFNVKVPSKSSLERYEKMVPEELIRILVADLIKKAASFKEEKHKLLLEQEINMADYYLDSTCIKANIHYPVDWVLLRDATKTIMRAIILIRRQGLKNRMQEPHEFIKAINKLCIQMTHARNAKDSKKKRKSILRMMKKLMKKIGRHGKNYRDLLEMNWNETELTEKQAKRIILRIDNVLNKLPEAIKQAHERIIGERLVRNENKILSLYDENIHVIIRGKVDAQIEFGNALFLGEQEDGLIVDWKLYKDTAPADNKMLPESLERIKIYYDGFKPENVSTDKGFDSKANKKLLAINNIKSYMCPRVVNELQVQLNDDEFCVHQKRRGQTEARIGIFKNNFLGRPLRSKEFENREHSVAWGVLAHNLWVLARLPYEKVEFKKKAA
jgi:hypothetical protein